MADFITSEFFAGKNIPWVETLGNSASDKFFMTWANSYINPNPIADENFELEISINGLKVVRYSDDVAENGGEGEAEIFTLTLEWLANAISEKVRGTHGTPTKDFSGLS